MATNNIEVVISAKDYASKVLQGINKQVSGVAKEVGNVMAGLLKTTALAGAGVVGFGIKSAGSLEQTNIAFTNLYGSAEKAGETIKNLVDFANKTPFEMPDVSDNALQLKNVAGITDKELIPTLTRLGDIASSQGKSLSQVTQAYLDAITGQNERLKEFGITAKVHGDMVDYTFRGVTTTVKNTRDGIGEYLTKIGEMEGIQGGMMKQSQTLNGLFSTFKDTVFGLTRSLVGLSDTGEIIKGGLLDTLKNGLKDTIKWIEDNKQGIKDFGDKLGDVFKTVQSRMLEFIENSKEIYKSIQKFKETNPTLTKLAFGITVVALALLLLNTNPIMLLIGGLVLLIANWEKVKLNLGGGLTFMAKDIKEKLGKIKKYFEDFFPNVKKGFDILVGQAKQWGANLIQMFIDGLWEGVNQLKASVVSVATTISDYLGFHSPTKKGPGSDADKWMPNLIKMLEEGLGKTSGIEEKSMQIAKAIGSGLSKEKMEELSNSIQEIASVAENAFYSLTGEISGSSGKIKEMKESLMTIAESYRDLKVKSKEEIDKMKADFDLLKLKGIEAINGILQKFTELKMGMRDIEAKGINDLANRVLEIQARQENITKELQNQNLEEQKRYDLLQEQVKLQNELQLAKGNIKEEDVNKVKAENEKSITQKILDRVKKEKEDQNLKLELVRQEVKEQENLNAMAEAESLRKISDRETQLNLELEKIRTEGQAKNEALQLEKTNYLNLVSQKKLVDDLYFANFQTKISSQISETQKAINLLETLKKGSGTSSSELFNKKADNTNNPNNINVNINMGGVVANNNTDVNGIAETISQKLTRSLQLQKLGIS